MNPYLITAAIGYLLGSIPFGFLLVRIFKGEDVRASGSGNIGATNVARKSPVLGVGTLLLDAAKGLAAVAAARALFTGPHQQLLMTVAAFFAVLGHLFPVWLKFRGGKGVATGFGVFLFICPWAALASIATFVVVFGITRYVAVASIIGAAVFPVFAWFLVTGARPPFFFAAAIAVSVLIIVKHHQNIRRLFAGTEYRFGASKPA
jgi:glycerol-3-phosphate acyltransferase PlsY